MFYETEQGKIYYEVYGQEGKPLVFLTHGLGIDHETFNSQLNSLADYYRIVVWDLPGHGESFSLNEDSKLSFSTFTECLLGLMDELKAKKAILIGQSLGGLISQYVAFYHPERVAAVVDIGSLPLHKGLGNKHNKSFKAFFPILNLLPGSILSFWFARQKAVKKETRKYLRDVTIKNGKRQILDTTKAMLEGLTEGIEGLINHPLLIIHGEKEQKHIIKSAKMWHDEAPMSEYAIIPNAGHIANQDNPQEFSRLVLSFLKKLKIHKKL